MTNLSTQVVTGARQLTAKLAYWDEYATPDLPETLDLELTADQLTAVREARHFMERNAHIRSVNVCCDPPEIESWHYDISYLIVFKDVGCYLFMHGKYACSEHVEYSVEI